MTRTRHGAVAVILAAALASGCQYLLGIDDPVPGSEIDAGACVRAPCDLISNCGCASGDTCSWDGNAGETYCRATDGSASRSDACNQDTDCVDGTLCVINVCRQPCLNDGECGATNCRADFDPLVPSLVCGDACTPVSNAGCPGTDTCIPVAGQDAAFCIPGEDIAAGSPCTDRAFSCEPGAICYRDADSVDRCHLLCDPAAGAPCVGACIAKADLMVGGTSYGLCP